MIEKMKKLFIVVPQDRRVQLVSGVRDLGVVHISEMAAPNSAISTELAELSRVRSLLQEVKKTSSKSATKASTTSTLISGAAFDSVHAQLTSAIKEKATLSDQLIKLAFLRDSVAKWGDFDPEEVKRLQELGLRVSFYLIDPKAVNALPEEVKYIKLKSIEKKCAIAVIGQDLGPEYAQSRFELPEMGLSQIQNQISSSKKRISEIDALFSDSTKYIPSYDRVILRLTDKLVFERVSDGTQTEQGLTILTGFIPEADLADFRKTASANSWAYALDDPGDDDPVPTKVRYNKVTKMMEPLFTMLGTTPGYREYDTSFWFLLFMALFFAMIIGDAAYGLIFLVVGIVLNIKTKKLSNLNLLLYVMSIATIIWGALTGTWFGSEAAMDIPFLRMFVIPQIANYPEKFGVDATAAQNSVMKFCFSIGTIQLSLACIMNVVRKWKEKSIAFVADFAWLAMIISIYFLALMLVIGASVNIKLIFAIIISGLLIVILFGSQAPGQSFGKGIKAGLGGAFTTFLDTISAFGNVMSYIRLFAVGMASLAIAQSFNGMASSMLRGWAFPAGMLILIIGHALNIVMGMLSVIVHGVRLNLLEFSGQLGMEWAGIPYEPFKKNS